MDRALDAPAPTRRRHPRVVPESHRPVLVDIAGENFIDVFKARDLSEGGVGLMLPHGFAQCRVDSPVRLVISLPAPVNGSFSVDGRIRHRAQGFFGVQFLRMGPAEQRLLRRYITARTAAADRWLTPLRSWWSNRGGGTQ